MYRAGVTCSDCHNAHSLKLRGTGNNVCLHCHLPLNYDTPAHHHHKAGTDAALCRSCHMRMTTYMVVDPRYDHSMRVPRVDYSIAYGIPNACTTPCHEKKPLTWANDAIVKWYGPTRARGNDYVAALTAARRQDPGAAPLLRAAVLNRQFPPIARATALAALADHLSVESIDALHAAIGDEDALLRATAARALAHAPPADRWRLGSALLQDPVRLVRAWAAEALADTPVSLLTAEDSRMLAAGIDEDIGLEQAVGERPEAHVNLGNLYLRQGRLREAEAELTTALRLDPRSVPALVNLADLCRATGREADVERYLKAAIRIEPSNAVAVHALGLAYIRTDRSVEALTFLRRAFELDPSDTRYGYVYALALDSQGKTVDAVKVLTAVQQTRPADRDVQTALATFEAKLGRINGPPPRARSR
jgi:tetratricopeptide (TPR) repeat protein